MHVCFKNNLYEITSEIFNGKMVMRSTYFFLVLEKDHGFSFPQNVRIKKNLSAKINAEINQARTY